MNKSLRALLAVIVLAFAAAGLYYAWFAPTKPALEKIDLQKRVGPPVYKPEVDPFKELPATASTATSIASGSSMSGATSGPVSVSPSTTAAPSTGSTTSTMPSPIPPGFTADTTPMQPLPTSLPGFTPATATGAVVGARAAQTSSSNSMGAAPTVGQPAIVSSAPTSRAQSSPGAPTPSTTVAPIGAVVPSGKNSPSSTSTFASPTTAATKTSVASPSAATVHVVVEGDTLTSIAKQYWGTSQGWENIEKANPGLTPNNLKLGAKLNIPAKDAAVSAPVKSSTSNSGSSTGGSVSNATGGDYEVVSGDTLSKISNKVYGDGKHWKQIYDANKKVIGDDASVLVVGTKLTLPGKPESTSKAASSAPTTPSSKATTSPAPAPKSSTSAPTSTSPSMGSSTSATPAKTPSAMPSPSPNSSSSTAPMPASSQPTSAPTPTPPIGSPTKPS
ncbi:MAG: LysM peptidoglycan-binding domain-containing protein [Planctomycetota bacterium]|nr:MAG: LysM peptidoglycan-binding domain-containing protein [Planctomycetota bacterium]